MDIENNFDIQKLKGNLLKYVREHKKLSVYVGAILLILSVSFCALSTKQEYNLSKNQKDAIAAVIETFNEIPERRDKSVFCAAFTSYIMEYIDGNSATRESFSSWTVACYQKIYPEISEIEEKSSIKIAGNSFGFIINNSDDIKPAFAFSDKYCATYMKEINACINDYMEGYGI